MSQNPTRVFPSLLPDSDEEFVDDSYSRAELERMDWSEIRGIAAEYESDEINGQSDRDDMEAFLEGRERL